MCRSPYRTSKKRTTRVRGGPRLRVEIGIDYLVQPQLGPPIVERAFKRGLQPPFGKGPVKDGPSRGGLLFGAAWLDVTAQDDACRWIYQMGLFAHSADDRLLSVGIHGYIVCGKALNAKARVQAAVDEWRHSIIISGSPGGWH